MPTMQAHMTPQDDTGKNKGDNARKFTAKSVAAAAVILACTLGVMCTSTKARAAPPMAWFSRTPTGTSDCPPSLPATMGDSSSSEQQDGVLAKSLDILREIFKRDSELKPAQTPKTLLQVLKDGPGALHPKDLEKVTSTFSTTIDKCTLRVRSPAVNFKILCVHIANHLM